MTDAFKAGILTKFAEKKRPWYVGQAGDWSSKDRARRFRHRGGVIGALAGGGLGMVSALRLGAPAYVALPLAGAAAGLGAGQLAHMITK